MKLFRKKTWVAFDWGHSSWKWAEYNPETAANFALEHLEIMPAPATDAEALSALQNQVAKRGLKGSPVACAFYDSTLTIRLLRLPEMPSDDLIEAIRWQLRDIAEPSIDDYYIRYSFVEPAAGGQESTLLAYAIHQRQIQKRTELLKQAGLQPKLIEPAPVSLAYWLAHCNPDLVDGWIGCADLGVHSPYFLVLGKGKLCYVQPLRELENIPPDAANFTTQMGIALQNILDNFFVQLKTDKIDRLFLTGNGAGRSDLTELLSKNLGIPTTPFQPFARVKEWEGLEAALSSPHLFGPVIGLAHFAYDTTH